jgi:hypothetical protein
LERAGGVAQGVGPEFKPQWHQKKPKTQNKTKKTPQNNQKNKKPTEQCST